MKIYKVGGAVRDQLLGLESMDNDWVVVGSTPREMISMGYTQVGKDFPVFLHPETKEEYALARKERSTGPEHTAFNFSYSPNVTLEEDLSRRDITINAIAIDDSGNLIDPFNGKDDLKNKTIRHVSDAFIEDPLRVLRVARFYSKLAPLGFKIEQSTETLLTDLIPSIVHLPGERIWQEIQKVLNSKNPLPFFELIWMLAYQSGFYSLHFEYTETFIGTNALSFWPHILPRGPAGTEMWEPKDFFMHRFSGPSWKDGVYIERHHLKLNPGLNSAESWWAITGMIMKNRSLLDGLNDRFRIPKSYRKMSELVYDFRETYFKEYADLSFEKKVQVLYKNLEKINPSKSHDYALDIVYLAAHNILGSSILNWEPFIQGYAQIIPSEDDKKLEGQEIKKILKDKKIKFIEEELKKDLD
tara:strand:+ start:811 stop:2052 length:1242 start_codon:yes stop_codon:yes gene_type:complete